MGLPVKNSDIFPYLNEQGLVELIDIQTGKVISIQRSKEILLEHEFVPYETPSGTVLLQKGVSLDMVYDRSAWAYSEFVVDMICTQIMEGKSLAEICRQKNYPPYHVICRWRQKHPEITEMFNQAYKDRAEYLVGEAQELVDGCEETQEAINKVKAQADVRKWIASKDAPNRYGTKVEVSGEIGATLVIETGIRRKGDPGFNKDEAIHEEKDITPTHAV